MMAVQKLSNLLNEVQTYIMCLRLGYNMLNIIFKPKNAYPIGILRRYQTFHKMNALYFSNIPIS